MSNIGILCQNLFILNVIQSVLTLVIQFYTFLIDLEDIMKSKYFILLLIFTSLSFTQNITPNNLDQRYNNCIKIGRMLGVVGGGTMGLAHIYWSATNQTSTSEPLWKNIVTGVPSSLIGGYVGYETTEWATKQILNGNPKPGKAFLKGALYGGIGGAITFTASVVPLFVIGHYMETIQFNFDGDETLFGLIGASILGGIGYGGTFGVAIGLIYGPSLSIYMKF